MKRTGLNYTGNDIVFAKILRGAGANSNLNLYQSHYMIFNVISRPFLCSLEFHHCSDERERGNVNLCGSFLHLQRLDISTELYSHVFSETYKSQRNVEHAVQTGK